MTSEIYPTNTRDLAQKRRDLAPETEAAFQAFSKQVFANGALSEKFKQIICDVNLRQTSMQRGTRSARPCSRQEPLMRKRNN